MVISAPSRPEPKVRKLSAPGGLRLAASEIAIWLAAYGASLFAGVFALGSTGTALRNTRTIIGLERALGIFCEIRIHEFSLFVPGMSPSSAP
jgi:hypothetical protein